VNSKISEKDKKTWDEFLSKNQKLPNKDNVQTEIQVKKTRTFTAKVSKRQIRSLRTL
jgi:hypothetical protein